MIPNHINIITIINYWAVSPASVLRFYNQINIQLQKMKMIVVQF